MVRPRHRFGGADKLGHAYTGRFSRRSPRASTGAGAPTRTRARLGAFSGLLLTTTVELGDGLSPDHGFSWEDQVVNMAGVRLE
ncbi:DUF2279 domain-containing protein [Halomonas rhizosphaerae]|uniref:DUF2279 domain-containing protein n=1 Tax=Halomonas rhizosphaerae TaxID=3043296 RepID=UPI00398CEC50